MTADERNLIQKWIVELRSGKYTQGRLVMVQRSMRPDGKGNEYDEYCCLGVLAHIVDPLSDSASPFTGTGYIPVDMQQQIRDILKEEGLRYHVSGADICPYAQPFGYRRTDSCVEMNDGKRLSFDEIADILEEELEYAMTLPQPA